MKKKILVVDDEVSFTTLLKLVMKHFEIQVVNEPEKAIETAKTFKPDVAVLDFIMPNIDGGEVAAKMKADPLLKHIPIIFLSAIVGKKKIVIDGVPHLGKPVNPEDLERCINEVLGD